VCDVYYYSALIFSASYVSEQVSVLQIRQIWISAIFSEGFTETLGTGVCFQ